MSVMHAPFVAPPAGQGISFVPLTFAVLPVSAQLLGIDSSGLLIPTDFHAPPIFSPPNPLPLRI